MNTNKQTAIYLALASGFVLGFTKVHAISHAIVASSAVEQIQPVSRYVETGENIASIANQLFPYKGPADPIFIVVTGQSNAVQIAPSRVPMERNPLVRDWATDGVGDGKGTSLGSWFWQTPDPNGVKRDVGTAIVTGYPQGARGGTAWGLADHLSKATGRVVYMVCTAQGSQPISQWEPGAGAVGLELDMQVSDALTALQLEYPNVKFADVVVWIQGEEDAVKATPPDEYADQWFRWRDYVEGQNNPAPWANSTHTSWYLVQMAQEIPVLAAWPGQTYVRERSGGRTVLMPSAGKETFDRLHFWGDEATLFGEEIATDLISRTKH